MRAILETMQADEMRHAREAHIMPGQQNYRLPVKKAMTLVSKAYDV